jgi:biotin-(acetyl-CoA carboxylase) ligase
VSNAIRGFEVDAVAGLITDFGEFDAYHGETVQVVSTHNRTSGINRGIDARGQLRLETDRGIELHAAAEISLRPMNA